MVIFSVRGCFWVCFARPWAQVDGTREQPITIKGPSSGPTAIVKGDDRSGTCVEISHDYYILDVRVS